MTLSQLIFDGICYIIFICQNGGGMMIKNIVFDMGGVLVDFDPKGSVERHFAPEFRETVLENVYRSDEWKAMDKGTFTVDEALGKMTARLPESLCAEVRKMVIEREAEMPPIAEMYPIVKALKENGYKIYLLSNCPDWFDSFKKSVPAFGYFDGFIISANYNEVKPGEKIYRILFKEFSLKPEECFFIDDMQANTDTAKRLGMAVHCFSDRNFDRLKNEMRKNNINI